MWSPSAEPVIAAGGAQGLIICTPDTRLGPAIVAKARGAGLKLLAVDDQFIGADGRLIARFGSDVEPDSEELEKAVAKALE